MPRGINAAGDVVRALSDGTPTNDLFREFDAAAAQQNAKRDGALTRAPFGRGEIDAC